MHGKFIQIAVTTVNGQAVVYALDEQGNIFEKVVGLKDAKWVLVTR